MRTTEFPVLSEIREEYVMLRQNGHDRASASQELMDFYGDERTFGAEDDRVRRKNGKKRTKIRAYHIFASLLVFIGSIAFLFMLWCYPNKYPDLVNIGIYLCISIGIPFLLVLLCWKRKKIKWVTLVIGITLTLAGLQLYKYRIVYSDTQFENYLREKSEFNTVASSFLPSYGDLDRAQNVEYLHKWSMATGEYIWLSASFTENEYDNMVARIENTFTDRISKHGEAYRYQERGDIHFDSVVYSSMMISHDKKFYTLAYAADDASCRIAYLFFSCEQISYMSANDAFQDCCQ